MLFSGSGQDVSGASAREVWTNLCVALHGKAAAASLVRMGHLFVSGVQKPLSRAPSRYCCCGRLMGAGRGSRDQRLPTISQETRWDCLESFQNCQSESVSGPPGELLLCPRPAATGGENWLGDSAPWTITALQESLSARSWLDRQQPEP